MKTKDIKDRLSSLWGRLEGRINWKIAVMAGIGLSLVLCLYHVYSFMKGIGA